MPRNGEDHDAISHQWRMTCLVDTYGAMLNAHQLRICRMYYDEDMSLAEIAQREGVSRQGVHGALRRAERQLEHYEQTVGLWAQERALYRRIEAVAQALDHEDTAGAREMIRDILADAARGEETDGL